MYIAYYNKMTYETDQCRSKLDIEPNAQKNKETEKEKTARELRVACLKYPSSLSVEQIFEN